MTTITEKISSIKLMETRIEELKTEKRNNISEIKDSFISRFERLYPMADIDIKVGSSDVKFYYKGKDIFSLDVVRDGVIRPNTYMNMGRCDKELSIFELERFVLMGRIADTTRTQYKEVARLLNELETSIYKAINDIDEEINKIKNFIRDEEEKIFKDKLDYIIDFYSDDVDFTNEIDDDKRDITLGYSSGYFYPFNKLRITSVSKSKKTFNLEVVKDDYFSIISINRRMSNYTQIIRELYELTKLKNQ